MHEQGKKHKENVEKFLRNIRRRDNENRKEEEKTKRELDRIERVIISNFLFFLNKYFIFINYSLIRKCQAAMKQYKKDIILEAPGASMAALTSTSNTSTVKSSFSEHDIIYAGSVAEPSYIPPVDSSESAM